MTVSPLASWSGTSLIASLDASGREGSFLRGGFFAIIALATSLALESSLSVVKSQVDLSGFKLLGYGSSFAGRMVTTTQSKAVSFFG